MMARSFDLAPHAARHSTGAWLALVAAGLIVLGLCVNAAIAVQHLQDAQEAAQKQRSAARKHRSMAAERARERVSLEAAQKVSQQLDDRRNLPWAGLFTALETAGKESGGQVALMTMSTSATTAAGPQISLHGIASSPAAMLKYVRALRTHKGVHSVNLLSQEKSAGAGPDGVRFQLAVNWSRT